jgi:hypothetical protein
MSHETDMLAAENAQARELKNIANELAELRKVFSEAVSALLERLDKIAPK